MGYLWHHAKRISIGPLPYLGSVPALLLIGSTDQTSQLSLFYSLVGHFFEHAF
jgi:hypothetical protein